MTGTCKICGWPIALCTCFTGTVRRLLGGEDGDT